MNAAKTNQLFGTDGIRQEVGQFPLDDASISRLGRAIGTRMPRRGARIVMARDTRHSGEHIRQLIAKGILNGSRHTEIVDCGVIPTPGLSFIIDHGGFDYGIMITASHNPYTDNGIKIFNRAGEKISEEMEAQIEETFFQTPASPPSHRYRDTYTYTGDPGQLQNMYRDFLFSHTPGITINKIVLDCSHGATYDIAPRVFKEAGIDTVVTHAAPDGKNINRACGSTHLEKLKEAVMAEKADMGIAFDGDGDRVLLVDSRARVLNGDYALYLISMLFLRTRDDFKKNKIVVGTVMGNLGLEKSLEQMGIEYIRTPVGDKYVYREMKQRQSVLGGEESGHTILRNFQKTGDGILTALYVLKSLAYLGIAPAEAFDRLTLYPQVTKSIKVKEKKDLRHWDRLTEMTAAFNERYGENSRLLIRYSGTEPKIRLMMESRHRAVIAENIGQFEELIKSTIGTT